MEETTRTDPPVDQEARDSQLAAHLVWGESPEPARGDADPSQTRDMKEWVPNVWWNWTPSEEPPAAQPVEEASISEPVPGEPPAASPADAELSDETDGESDESEPQWRYTLTDHGIEPAAPPEPEQPAAEPELETEATASVSEDLDALFAPAVQDEEDDFRLRLDFPEADDGAPAEETPATPASAYDDTTALNLFARPEEADDEPPAPAASSEPEPVDRHFPDLFSSDPEPEQDDASWFEPRTGPPANQSDPTGDDVPETWVFTSGRFSGANGHVEAKQDRRPRGPRGRHRQSRDEEMDRQPAPEPASEFMGPVPVAIPAKRRFGSLLRVVAIALPVVAAGLAYLSFVR
jgi:hypothetical protein